MKKLFYLVILGAGIIGCTSDSMESEILESYDAKVKAQEVENSMSLAEAEICYGEAPVFVLDFPQRVNGRNEADTKIKIQMETYPGSGEWEDFADLTYSGAGPEEYIYDGALFEEGTYSFRANFLGSGDGPGYHLLLEVVDCTECTDELTADLTCGDENTLLITFTAQEAGPLVIQGGLTNGTEILSKESNVLSENENHPGVVNSDANVTRWEGEVDACEEVTITIEFEGGNGIGDWTAKRDEELLGETENQQCETEE